jgi:transposase-like protein
MKNNPKIVTLVMDLYFKGISYRKIVDHLKQFYGLEISHVALIKWIRKYVRLMKSYVDSFTPKVSGHLAHGRNDCKAEREQGNGLAPEFDG